MSFSDGIQYRSCSSVRTLENGVLRERTRQGGAHSVCFFLFVLKFSLDKSTGREGRLVPGNGDKVEWEVLANGF